MNFMFNFKTKVDYYISLVRGIIIIHIPCNMPDIIIQEKVSENLN